MANLWFLLTAVTTLLWVGFALWPWGLWRIGEAFESADEPDMTDALDDVTVLIPARNEAVVIERSLPSVMAQGADLKIILIDDGSDDATIHKARAVASSRIRIVSSEPLPPGWSGKLWALEQGRRLVTTPYILLLDADIELAPGILLALKHKMRREALPFVSLMAMPSMSTGWEKLLMPAFVYFFKILYPFRLVNSPGSRTAAAAGGCVLLQAPLLSRIGGFAAIKSAIIDDCTLARQVKAQGAGIWLGLTHGVKSIRGYAGLREIWDMVARAAYIQLHCSAASLILCTLAMVLLYVFPVFMLLSSEPVLRYLALTAVSLMVLTYLPILRFYGRSPAWALGLPLTAGFFLAMTWSSAVRYWRGERSRWKGRVYQRRHDGSAGE